MKRPNSEQSGAHKLHAAIGIIVVAAVLTVQALLHFGVITGRCQHFSDFLKSL